MKKLLTLTVCILVLSLLCTGCGLNALDKVFSSNSRHQESEESDALDRVTGQVENDVVNGWKANVFVLDDPIVGCESMTIDFTAEVLSGARCKEWKIYARTLNGWQAVGSLELTEGTGSTTKNLNLGESGYSDASTYIDAVAIQPQASGSYSWNWWIDIYNVKQTKDLQLPSENPKKPAKETKDTEESDWLDVVSGQWEHDVVNGWSTNVFALNTTIQGCESLTIYFNADMQHGARCKDWTIYARSNDRWTDIGSLYLSGGTGETTQTLTLDGTMYIDAICIEPTARGSYSWNVSIAVYDVQERYQ